MITEAIMLIGGGYETVVAALAWTLALLPQNPQAQQRLYDEVDALNGALPSYADLDRLEWAKACFDEGQRLQGLLLQPRFAMIDDVIGGYRIRRGTLIGLPIYALQRDPRWWAPTPTAMSRSGSTTRTSSLPGPTWPSCPSAPGRTAVSVRPWVTWRPNSFSPSFINGSGYRSPPAGLPNTTLRCRGRSKVACRPSSPRCRYPPNGSSARRRDRPRVRGVGFGAAFPRTRPAGRTRR
ncbi:cytochrome P450 family protein [Mycobacterium kansasii]|uniref:Cytochrome P450 family protein n=1 Tax=Mycobacterium kansasii TaxID=1768 RepID=A0A1V3XI55_MYCKA|nr:cytochrome P450 family protein [Mycobacterium kansasii]